MEICEVEITGSFNRFYWVSTYRSNGSIEQKKLNVERMMKYVEDMLDNYIRVHYNNNEIHTIQDIDMYISSD
jgi:hypothetical protein